ncbi:MAG: hypothetical protein IPG16_22920 [Comamonadaceae bacterium]|nr:hypothetical protein [Comamonadaceae bacterium]
MAAIWGAAYAAAQVLTLGRLETVTAERDAARAQVAAQAQDVASLAAADAGTETVTAALSAKQRLETTVENHQGEIARLTGELER